MRRLFVFGGFAQRNRRFRVAALREQQATLADVQDATLSNEELLAFDAAFRAFLGKNLNTVRKAYPAAWKEFCAERIVSGADSAKAAEDLLLFLFDVHPASSWGLLKDKRDKILAAVAANLRVCFADGKHVVFNLDDSTSVKILVRDSDNARVLLQRHRIVPAFQTGMASRIATLLTQGSAAGGTPKLPVLHGCSGSGKTANAIAVATALNSEAKDRTCVYLTPHLLFTVEALKTANSLAKELSIDKDIAEEIRNIVPAGANVDALVGIESALRGMDHAKRDNVVHALVHATVYSCVEVKKAPKVDRRRPPLLIVVDEVGEYPLFVGGMCRKVADICSSVSRSCTQGKCPVYLVAAGTGIEDACQRDEYSLPPEAFELMLVQTDHWEALKVNVPKDVREFIDSDESGLGRTVRCILSNARALALFMTIVRPSTNEPTHAVVRSVALDVANAFFSLNAMSNLRLAQRIDAISLAAGLQALPLSRTATTNAHVRDGLMRRFGLVVDRAVTMKLTLTAPAAQPTAPPGYDVLESFSNGTALVLSKTHKRVRYEVQEAQIAMFMLQLGLGDRDGSSDGFERLAADFIALCMLWARPRYGFGDIKEKLDEVSPLLSTQQSRGWHPPLLLIDRLKSAVASADHPPEYYLSATSIFEPRIPEIRIMTTAVRIQAPLTKDPSERAAAWAAVDEVVEALFHVEACPHLTPSAWMPGRVLVNGPRSDFADIVATVGDAVLLVRAKRCVDTPLQRHQLFAELHKMGHRDWRCCFASWLNELQTHTELVQLDFLERSSVTMPSDLRDTLTTCLFPEQRRENAKCCPSVSTGCSPAAVAEAFRMGSAWVKRTADGERALRNWLERVNPRYTTQDELLSRNKAWEQKSGCFVVMAYGATPDDVDDVPADVLLLHAGPVVRALSDGGSETAASAAAHVCSYYPFHIAGKRHRPPTNTNAFIDAVITSLR